MAPGMCRQMAGRLGKADRRNSEESYTGILAQLLKTVLYRGAAAECVKGDAYEVDSGRFQDWTGTLEFPYHGAGEGGKDLPAGTPGS